MENPIKTTSRRGFASMDKERQRDIARKGGVTAHVRGTAHKFDSDEAAKAARMGHQKGSAHEFNSEEARIAGRKGGLARAMKRKLSQGETVTASAPQNTVTASEVKEPETVGSLN